MSSSSLRNPWKRVVGSTSVNEIDELHLGWVVAGFDRLAPGRLTLEANHRVGDDFVAVLELGERVIRMDVEPERLVLRHAVEVIEQRVPVGLRDLDLVGRQQILGEDVGARRRPAVGARAPPVPEVPPAGVPSDDLFAIAAARRRTRDRAQQHQQPRFRRTRHAAPSQSRLRLQPAYQPALADNLGRSSSGRPCRVTTSARMRYGPSTRRRSPNQGLPVARGNFRKSRSRIATEANRLTRAKSKRFQIGEAGFVTVVSNSPSEIWTDFGIPTTAKISVTTGENPVDRIGGRAYLVRVLPTCSKEGTRCRFRGRSSWGWSCSQRSRSPVR